MQNLRLVAVGDLMLGDSPQVFGFGVASMIRRHGMPHMLAPARPLLEDADLTIGNLEVVVAPTPAGAAFGDRVYRGDPAAIPALVEAGIEVVSVCTNHMMQHGQAAFESCVGSLRAQGLVVVGADCPAHGVVRTAMLERQGRRIAILSYNFRPIQYHVAPPAWPTPDADLIAADIAQVRASADLVVVTLHWGDEFIEHPSPAQVALAHRIVDAGADIVIGHHPHIVQGVERYRGAVIAYSLGNFVYDQWQERLRRSMVLRLDVRAARDIDVTVVPMMIDRQHRPVPCEGRALAREVAVHAALAEAVGRATENEYRERLQARYGQFRREILLHYATQFWRFHPRDFAANLMGIVGRRV